MTIEFDEMQLQPGPGGQPEPGGRRRRVVAGVVAAMLVAAAGGVGYGIGRGVDHDSASTGAGEESADAGDESAAETSVSPNSISEESGTPSSDAVDEAATSDDTLSAGLAASGGVGYAAFGSQPMETLFERTTDSGATLRVQLGQTWPAPVAGDFGAAGWLPAPWCYESGQLRVALAGDGVIDVGGVGWYAEPFQGRSVSALLLGGSDQDPQWVVVVQTPADVTRVRVEFADGTIDESAPQNGIVALIGPGEAPTMVEDDGYTYWMDPTPSYVVHLDGGAEPVTIDSGSAGPWNDPEFRASCTAPPPALPDPGEQPAEPAAAEAEIRAAMTAIYGAMAGEDERSDLLDDSTGVAEARAQVEAGDFADAAAGATATIEELVFTTPGEAWFRYRIDSPTGTFDARYGIAVLVDGIWKITRSTICQDLSLAGGDCGGDWMQIFPPGALPEEGYPVPATIAIADD